MIPTNIEEVFALDQEAEDLQKIRANDKQISGSHYKQFKGYEPWDCITAWRCDYLTGSAIKYLARWPHKGGVDDIKKAMHFLEKLLELEEEKKNGLPGTT
jgi:hypothetical protein